MSKKLKTRGAFGQPTMVRHLRIPVRDKRQLKFDMELSRMMVGCNLPFNLVEQTAFKQFFTWLEPKYHLKSRFTFARNKLIVLYANVRDHVETVLDKELKKCQGVAFTTDVWTSRFKHIIF